MIDRMSETRKIGYKEVVLGRQGKLFFPLVVVDNTAGVPQVKDLGLERVWVTNVSFHGIHSRSK